MKIGIVMVVLNLWDQYTKQALESIKSKHNLYFVLVDNGSTDNTYIEATKLISENFHYKRFEKNEGLQKAWNYGINDCFVNHQCDYVFVPNNDVLFQADAIDNLVDRFEKERNIVPVDDLSMLDLTNSDLAMVTCMNIVGECQEPSEIFMKDPASKKDVAEAEHPDFSAYMINQHSWDLVGEFDEGFFPAYYEDNDYHRRIKLAGLKAIVLPTSLYYHYGSRTQHQVINKPIVDSSKSHQYFIEKWGGSPEHSGEVGTRLWPHPFNDEQRSLKWTKQSQ